MTETKIARTRVTEGQLHEAMGGQPDAHQAPGMGELVVVECPVGYDVDGITAGDIVHDPAVRTIRTENRVSVNDILADDYDWETTAVWWSDTGYVECSAHWGTDGWRQTVTPSDEPAGVVLDSATVRCDACAEADS